MKKKKFSFSKLFTYLFMIALSIIIIYPLLITATSAFKAGNMIAFRLDFDADWTLNNFRRLFNETPYLTWYKNTFDRGCFHDGDPSNDRNAGRVYLQSLSLCRS